MAPRRPDTPWYRVPLLWLGLIVLLGSLAASVHLIIVSRSGPQAITADEPGAGFRGVPLKRGDAQEGQKEKNDH